MERKIAESNAQKFLSIGLTSSAETNRSNVDARRCVSSPAMPSVTNAVLERSRQGRELQQSEGWTPDVTGLKRPIFAPNPFETDEQLLDPLHEQILLIKG